MKKQVFIHCILLTAALCFVSGAASYLQNAAKITHLMETEETKENLRRQEVSPRLYETFCGYEENGSYTRYDYLCASLFTGDTKQRELEDYLKLIYQYKKEEFRQYTAYEAAIWEDLRYFPIPVSEGDEDLSTAFENSWMTARTFGGKRGHEGTDIMASMNERGHYPVISMTDGIVEKMGWLPQGGYRLGIRSPHGGYFYYAHLYDYAEGLQEGSVVTAGEFLGFMGDSGYSEVEGTVGNFDVHLHLGIYLNDTKGTEFSVNSYWILKYLENRRLSSRYE